MRLDHLLSKEHLQQFIYQRVLVVGVVRSKGPQHRRVFCGGCSWVEYQQTGAWWHGPACQYEPSSLLWGWWLWNAAGLWWRVSFGALLGPEATGLLVAPFLWGVGGGTLFLVSLLHGSCTFVCGVCGVGLLFENCIVDASIFYRSNFQ